MSIKYTILCGIFIVLSFPITAQPTSSEEYNYVTIGYKQQLDAGLDMKKGYRVESLSGFEHLEYGADGERGLYFKGLYRGQDKLPCAIMAIYERHLNGKTTFQEYFCLPMAEAIPLWDRTFQQLKKMQTTENSPKVFFAMTYALMKFSSSQATLKMP